MSSCVCKSVLSASRMATRSSLRRPLAFQSMAIRSFTNAPIFTASARVKGARQGIVEGENLDLKLSTSKALGKPNDGKTNPEEMFAGGFAACFASACNAVAAQNGTELPHDMWVDGKVALCGDMKKLDMFLEVELTVHTPADVSKKDMEAIVEKAKAVCPYSKAVKGNVEVHVKVEDPSKK